ncbi:hypothetical protein BGZ47_001618, partial [Haplosporangium gracile]
TTDNMTIPYRLESKRKSRSSDRITVAWSDIAAVLCEYGEYWTAATNTRTAAVSTTPPTTHPTATTPGRSRPIIARQTTPDSIWANSENQQSSSRARGNTTHWPRIASIRRQKRVLAHGCGSWSRTFGRTAIVDTFSHQDGTLVALDLIDPQGVTSQHKQQILVNSKYLRCLEVRHSDTPPTRTLSAPHGFDTLRTRLLVTDMLTAPKWRCSLLTNLHLEIGGISRSNESTAADARKFDQQERHRIQRQVYRQLDTLTCLQELRLGRACER